MRLIFSVPYFYGAIAKASGPILLILMPRSCQNAPTSYSLSSLRVVIANVDSVMVNAAIARYWINTAMIHVDSTSVALPIIMAC
eukprot:scaffold6146_cov16-Prasinocladus_malaysianus.AAC.1